MQRFFKNDDMNFATLIALGSAYRGCADVGEVLATIEAIPDGDREAWISRWCETADRLAGAAKESLERGHRVSARTSWLRASLYYDHASAMSPGSSDPDRYRQLWERQRDCWDEAAPLFSPAVEKVAIPYEGTTLEGYVFRPDGSATPGPWVILNNGSDGPVVSMWSQGGAAALDRGWSALTFDGPGQGAAFHRQGLPFRPDWENVITPVLDWLLARDDVDPERVALHGVSQAGYWVPRAAAYEHRLAAIVADPGVVDVADSFLRHLPDGMRRLLESGDKESFDSFMAVGMEQDPAMGAMLRWRMAPYGTDSFFECYRMAMAMRLDDDTIAGIECPTLVTDPADEQFWPRQARQLYDRLSCPKKIVHFTRKEGANWHCEVAAQGLRDERVFDWLETVLLNPGAGSSGGSHRRRIVPRGTQKTAGRKRIPTGGR